MQQIAAFLQGLGKGNGVLSAIGGGLGTVQEHKRQNQTVSYLTQRGIPEGEAQILSQSPQAVIQVLQNLRKGVDPKAALELQGLNLDNQIKANKLANGPELPDTIQSLQWRAQAAGLQPGTQEYQKFMATGGDKQSLVTVNNGPNSDKFTEESDKAAAGRLNEYVSAGAQAAQMSSDMDTLLDLGRQIGTGKEAELMAKIGPWAQALGIYVDPNLGAAQAYKSITDRMAPQMRPVGAGSSSDTDVRMYMNSLPTIGNTPEGNEIIAYTNKAIADNKIAAAEIAQLALSRKISWQDAENQIRGLPNPYSQFKQYVKNSKAGGSSMQAGHVEDGYRFKGGDPANPQNWEKVN